MAERMNENNPKTQGLYDIEASYKFRQELSGAGSSNQLAAEPVKCSPNQPAEAGQLFVYNIPARDAKEITVTFLCPDCLIRDISITAVGKETIVPPYKANGDKVANDCYIFATETPALTIKGLHAQTSYIELCCRIMKMDPGTAARLSEAVRDRDEYKERYMQARHSHDETENACYKAIIERDRLKNENDLMERSLSWRLTKPLRFADSVIGMTKLGQRLGRGQELGHDYEKWIEKVEKSYKKVDVKALKYKPLISVLVPVYNVEDKYLVPCIESVLSQEYPNWELCLADDCSTFENIKPTLLKYQKDERVKVTFRETNGNISECTNTALGMATGEYIALLDCDDTLSPNALAEVANLLNEDPLLDFIYSDEDKISDDGKKRRFPHFKSDWAPDTFMSYMYTCHLGVYRRSIAVEIGGEKKGYDGAQDYDFVLRFTEKTNKIAHIPKILYHWREREGSTAVTIDAKPHAIEATKKTKEDALERRGLKAEFELVNKSAPWQPNYIWDEYPKVSVIIPSKDNFPYLSRLVKTFTEWTEYDNYEFVIVDNGSGEKNKRKYKELAEKYGAKYIYEQKDFNFSYMCNIGAKNASGEYFLFLNDDIEIINSDWLKRMVGQAMLPHTGAVGAKLLYPDKKTIQHAGVISIKVGPVNALQGYTDEIDHYTGANMRTLNRVAVTGACMLISRKKFDEAGGFSEDFPNNYNDVDFCFKLLEHGYYNTIRNDAVLIHHESISRGNDLLGDANRNRLQRECELLYERHPQFENRDPFYNPNLAQNRADFSCNFEML